MLRFLTQGLALPHMKELVLNYRCCGSVLLLVMLFVGGLSRAAEPKPQAPVAAEKPKVLFLDLQCTIVDPAVVETISDLVGAELGQHKKYDVITTQDLRQMAKLEVEKQKSGCSDMDCLSELAGAMGARYVVYGKVGQLAERTIITLNLFDSDEAKAVDRAVVSASSLGEVPELLPAAVAKLVGEKELVPPTPEPVPEPTPKVVAKTVPAPEPEPAPVAPAPVAEPEPPAPKRAVPWVRVGSAGAVAAVGAGLALALGQPAYSEMIRLESSYKDRAESLMDEDSPGEYLEGSATSSKASAKVAQTDYLAGPVYWLWSGYSVAAIAGAYAVWAYLTAPLLEEDPAEVTP